MTRHQQRQIERVRKELFERYVGHAPRTAEFKKFDVSESEHGTVFVVSEIGLINDEETLASVFCRDYRHIAIGKRGGLRLLSAKNRQRVTGNAALFALSR